MLCTPALCGLAAISGHSCTGLWSRAAFVAALLFEGLSCLWWSAIDNFMQAHHPQWGAVARSSHLQAALLILSFLLLKK